MTADPRPQTRTIFLKLESPGAIECAARLLRIGEPVCFPTDTVYGIGVHAYQPYAVERLFDIKERPYHLPIALLLWDVTLLETVCAYVPPIAWKLAKRFWPGGLSLVLRRSAAVPDAVTSGGPTVAVRVPDHNWVRELCRELGAPLAATSANLHGGPSPGTANEVRNALNGKVPLIIDGGPCTGGVASTVLDLTVTPPALLRTGAVGVQELGQVVDLKVD